ncbi:MAG TPA: hypothetical protein VJM33_17735 [Microthrixaceae bacterium]|nr:hypothetical protein [Microthrixaceae bacterium]
MTGAALALTAAIGVALLVAPGPRRGETRTRPSHTLADRVDRWLLQAGLPDVHLVQFLLTTLAVALLAGLATYAVFGGALAALGVAVAVALVPASLHRARRRARRATAADAWPALIEEIRVLTGAAGRSIPRALLEVGLRGPEDMRPAFVAAQREWTISTDFARSVAVLKHLLDSATADVVCETLLVANELGAVDLDRRLAELAEDRRQDTFARRDARAKQGGVRFARRFVIVVPAGMALAGLSLGDGRAAYQSAMGQVLVGVGVAVVGLCWLWSGQMLRLPDEERVFP